MYSLEPLAREYFSKQIGIFMFSLFAQNHLTQFALLISKRLELLLPIKYIPTGKAETVETIPLAFTISNELSPVVVNGFTLCWTKEALANFSQILKDITKIKNLPYASLMGL